MGLFEPAWMTKKNAKAEKAVASVAKVSNQAKLARIAHEAPLGQVRAAAASRIADQEMLFEIATNDRSIFARQAAVRCMDEAHLVRFAGKERPPELLKAYVHTNPEEDEILAVQLIGSSEALAELYVLLRTNGFRRAQAKGYPYWRYTRACEEAVEERMGETECAIAVRRLLDAGFDVSPTGFPASRVLSPRLRRELGIGVDKTELMAQFKEKPSKEAAQVLWPLLDEDEKPAMQWAAVDWLCKRLSGTKIDELIDLIDDQGMYEQLLMANPNHELNLKRLIDLIDDPEPLRRFLSMLDERDVYTYPAATKPPDPADDNFIIHTNYGNDHWAMKRVREAAEDRKKSLERGR